MDHFQIGLDEDKENASPTVKTPIYPKLTPPPPSPRKGRLDGTPGAYLTFDQARRPGQTPNTGRKRQALSALVESPPRASYADRVKGIFSNSAPPKKLHRWDGFALRTAAVPIANTSRIRKELVPWSPLTSESEDCSSNLKFQRSLETGHSSTEHVLNEASTAIEEDFSGSEAARYEARMEIDEHTPPEDNEQACHLPHFPVLECQQEHHCVPEIREPTPRIEDESSDAWTGDDEFLPRSARRQKRIDRKTVASPKFNASARTFTSQHLRAPGMPQSGLHVGEGYAWPVSRTSGFKGRAPVPCYPELPPNPAGVTTDQRSSDADDELDSDSA